jgi:hypothetical protein
MQTKEAKLVLGAAIVDDILAIAVLSVVVTMVQTGNLTPNIVDILFFDLRNIRNICLVIDRGNNSNTKNSKY